MDLSLAWFICRFIVLIVTLLLRTTMTDQELITEASRVIETERWRDLTERDLRMILSLAIDRVFWVTRHLHHGYYMIRLRINEIDRTFTHWEMSYKPAVFNQTFQRASTPDKAMFYATSCERRHYDWTPYTDLDFGLVMGLLETIPELREECVVTFRPKPLHPLIEPKKTFKRKVTLSLWSVMTEIRLVEITPMRVYDDEVIRAQQTNSLYATHYHYHPHLQEATNRFLRAIADHFTKPITDNVDYTISATVAELVTTKGFDGVCFPSVRGARAGTNFALNQTLPARDIISNVKQFDIDVAGGPEGISFLQVDYPPPSAKP